MFYRCALANVIEHQLAVADRPGPIPHRKRLHAINNFSVHQHFSPPRYLEEKDFALVCAAVAVLELFDKKNPAALIELDFAIDQIRNR